MAIKNMFNFAIPNLATKAFAFKASRSIMKLSLDKSIAKTTLLIGRKSRQFTPVDTGRLRASTREQIRPTKGIVSTNTMYDIYVHQGTSRMKARPYMKQAAESVIGEAEGIFKDGVEDALNNITRRT